jgi:hypothetical protein
MHEIHTLATFDHERIGREFANPAVAILDEQRRHQARRSQLMVAGFKDSLAESASLPKVALRNTCAFQAKCVRFETFVTWSVTVFIASVAGTICALVIKNLHIQ